jgi:CTD kinase subunit alpha
MQTSHTTFTARYVAMKDSWSHGDDRRDRGRVDRGVPRSRRSRSPATRRPEADRELNSRDRGAVKPRPVSDLDDRPRERSSDRRRRQSRSPLRDSREEVRERNRGRELLDTRGSEKPKRGGYQSPPGKRRKSRSPSVSRSHHKKSKRALSRSPSRPDGGSLTSARGDKKRRPHSPNPPRRLSPDRNHSQIHGDSRNKHNRESGISERRGRSPGPTHDRADPSREPQQDSQRPKRTPHSSPARQKPRERSPFNQSSFDQSKDRDKKRHPSPSKGRRSPDVHRYEPPNRSRQPSPGAPKGPKSNRGSSPRRDKGGRPPRDEYRPGPGKQKGKGRPSAASGANSIEVRRPSISASGANSIEVRKPPNTASGANSIEVKADKMAGRGFYGGQQGYNPNQQMQAAFPLKAQYQQQQQVDPRQYSQSPQHQMSPNSYHNSPQQSPYNSGRGNWGTQQQYSPQG